MCDVLVSVSISSFNQPRLVSSFNPDSTDSHRSDFDQIKYAFRSLEMHAPWFNHIYLVTNGQAPPAWLDTTNPDVTVVHHDQFFRNSSHLPTFASPAIEANMHRIPGLAEKFIYFNDDFALLNQVCPSDFVTDREGYKLRFTYEIMCNKKCRNDLVMDGQCDAACDNINCQFDGGDCLDERPEELDLTDSKRPTYAASLDYVNIKFNEHFGRRRRYNVPHIPMLVEKQIMLGKQKKHANYVYAKHW